MRSGNFEYLIINDNYVVNCMRLNRNAIITCSFFAAVKSLRLSGTPLRDL